MVSPSVGRLFDPWVGLPDWRAGAKEDTRAPGLAARRNWARRLVQPIDTATQVVVRVTPSTTPMDSVTRLPIASREAPSTTAMKAYGPVPASQADPGARP